MFVELCILCICTNYVKYCYIVIELFGDMQIDYEILRVLGRLCFIYFVGCPMMIDFCSIFEFKVVMRVAVVVEALRTDI